VVVRDERSKESETGEMSSEKEEKYRPEPLAGDDAFGTAKFINQRDLAEALAR